MFEKVKKNFGFGCMRLPVIENENGKVIDTEQFKKMVDIFLESGFNYFDTAHGYHSGMSEIALRECLVDRYPRESYVLVDKLTKSYFEKEEDVRPHFEEQLKICGVEYFDFYLMHCQTAVNYEKFSRCKAYETAFQLKEEGKIKHVGFSFHDSPELLDKILSDHPALEFVQIQFNYLDYEDPGVRARECYEVCVKHGKPVIIMEPVKGGKLADLPLAVHGIFDSLNGGSPASYAIRYAGGFENVFMVLSGMSNLEQTLDNISFMKDYKPLDAKEQEAVAAVTKILRKQDSIPCTACRYCVDGCPANISIPDLLADLNAKKAEIDWDTKASYALHTKDMGKASDCVECGQCEAACPQQIKIIELLKDVVSEFE